MDKLTNLLNKKRKPPFLNKELSTTSTSSNTLNIKEEKYEIYFQSKQNNIMFKKNPNLKFKEKIIEYNDSLGYNDLFEIFTSIKDGISYIVSPNKLMHFCLSIYSLHNNKLIKLLTGHDKLITMVKYFCDNSNQEFLISADIDGIVIVWEINNIDSDIKKYLIKLKMKNYIFSCIMFHNKYKYIITSSCGNEKTNLFMLDNDNIKFVKNIKNSENISVYYLLIWFNKINKEYFLIQFCKKKIVINNIEKNEIYWNLIDNENKDACYMNGFIIDNINYDEYLYSCSMNGIINIWDLHQKILINSIFINNNFLSQIIQWNEKYIIIINGNKNNISVLDLESGIIISQIFARHEKGIMNIKKVVHPIYGESLLSCGLEGDIFIWTI